MALTHALFLVANIGDIKKCDSRLDPHCPTDKRYQFNTNVVYDPKGVLVARYHKYMLFGESFFDVPPKVELITFDTPFGKFGTFTCFDVLFSEPAVTLIVKKNVRNIVFPTAWGNELPFLSAIEFHSAFARSMRVNFLSANINIPAFRFTGSGIYQPNGVATYYYENNFMMGRLLIANVTILDNKNRNASSISYTPFKITQEIPAHTEQKKFTFLRLHERKSAMKVCNGGLCCYFDYAVASGAHHNYALGAFDGIDVSSTRSRYIQVCTIMKCANNSMTSCGQSTKHPSAMFTYFHIRGTFEASHVFPEVLSSRDENLILPSNQWTFDKNSLISKNGIDVPLLSASLYGRIYSRDPDLY